MSAKSRHALVHHYFGLLRLLREQLPNGELEQRRTLRVFCQEVSPSAELNECNYPCEFAERY